MTRNIRWWQIIAVIIIIAGVVLTAWTAQQLDQQMRKDLLTKTRIAVESIDPAMIESLNGSPSDLGSTDYQQLKAQMVRLRAADPSIRFAYLIGQRPEGIIFYVDSEPEGSWANSPPGQVYNEVTPVILSAFSDQTEMTEGPVSDRWGTWMSALVPVSDKKTGQSVALYGTDVDARYWNYTIARDSATIVTTTLLILLLVVTFGLTQRRNIREQRRLKASEDKFSSAFHTNPALMAVSSIEEGRFLDVNQSFLKTLGYSREEVIGRTLSDLGLYPDPAQWEVIQGQLAATGQVRDLDVKVTRKDHEVLDGLFSATVIEVAGTPCLLTVILDITDRKKAVDALQESESQLSSIIRVAPIGIGVVSNRVFRTVNDRICQMTGYTAEELIGNSSALLYASQEEFEYVGREKYGQITQKGSGSVGTRWQRKDGTIIDIILSSSPVDPSDLSVGVTFTALDITDRKLAEDTLLKVNQKLNVLSQLTRRELTNEIFVLNSYLELAIQEARGQEGIIVNIQKCEQAARSINEIAEFTRDYQDLGAKPPAWQNVKMTLLFGLSHVSMGNVLHSIEMENLEIFADPLLEKASQGLFENSLAHGGNVTQIRVWHRTTPEGVVLFFEDDGIGVPHEKKERIFLHREGTGTMVRGLFFTREILSITGLTIRETGEPGKGARFEVTVPNGMYRYSGDGAREGH
ncbi:MAG: PAS domain S-box protein [Methanomicrobiales archaeon]